MFNPRAFKQTPCRVFSQRGRPVSLWHADAYAPAGALCSTANDLLTFAEEMVAPTRLSREAIDLALQRFAPRPCGFMGLGWHLSAKDDWSWHNGGTWGSASYLGLSRSRKTAVVVLANQAVPGPVTSLGHALARCDWNGVPEG